MGSGGTWRWPAVPEDTTFPHRFHRPYLLGAARPDARWFYATPQVCWEVHLLRFLLGCLSRGGMTLSAVFDVYYMLWGASMDGTMYAGREHFVKKLSVALMAYGSMDCSWPATCQWRTFNGTYGHIMWPKTSRRSWVCCGQLSTLSQHRTIVICLKLCAAVFWTASGAYKLQYAASAPPAFSGMLTYSTDSFVAALVGRSQGRAFAGSTRPNAALLVRKHP